MTTYLMLGSFTDQGIRNIAETTNRAEAFQAMAAASGIEVKEMYWTAGPYDVMCLMDSPDEETVNALALKAGALGNVRTTLMRAFTRSEMQGIVAKIPN